MLLQPPIDSYVKLRNFDTSLCTTQTTGPSILYTSGMHLMSHFSRCCYYFMKSIELLSWTHSKMTSMVFHRMHQAEGPKRRPPGLPITHCHIHTPSRFTPFHQKAYSGRKQPILNKSCIFSV